MTGNASTNILAAIRKHVAANPVAKYAMCYLKYRHEIFYASTSGIRERCRRMGVQPAEAASVLFFTVHKCASTFMPEALRYLNKRYLGLRQVDLAGHIWNMKSVPVYEYIQEHSYLIEATGHLYVPLREYVQLDGLERCRRVVMVRDPRDVLVSHYFSIAYSHNLPAHRSRRAEFVAERERVKAMTLDEYVVQQAEYFRNTLEHYVSMAEAGATILRYEDMVLRFDEWLADLAEALGIKCDERDSQILRGMSGDGVLPTGDVFRHVRNREPGEYRKRLARETVHVLDEKFGKVLKRLGY